MKVAIYHPWIHLRGGGERVIMELAKRGKYSYTIFTHHYKPEETFEEFKKLKVVNLAPESEIRGVLSRGLTFGFRYILPSKLPLESFDVFLVSTGGIAELIAYRNHEIPTYCYCHTPLRAVHDEDYVKTYMLKNKGLGFRLLFKLSKKFYSYIEKPTWKYFIKVFVNSNNTKNRLLNGRLVPEHKIKIIHPGVDTKKFKHKSNEPFFFMPGRINKYKRQLLGIKAFKLFKKKVKGFKLVIAGHVAPKDREYYELIKKYAEKVGDVEIKTNVSDERLADLYSRCYAVLFTAVNEDWGLIPLEANASGKLCISVAEGGPLESIKNGYNGFLVEANPEAFAKKMIEVAKMNVEEYVENCLKEAKKYDWEVFAKKLESELNSTSIV